MSEQGLAIINHRRLRKGTTSFSLLKETFFLFHQGLVFKNYDPFFETLNEKIDQMISSGIFAFHESLVLKINPWGLRKNEEEIGAQVLTLDDLFMGFFIWFLCISICTIVFVVELCFRKISSAKQSKVITFRHEIRRQKIQQKIIRMI